MASWKLAQILEPLSPAQPRDGLPSAAAGPARRAREVLQPFAVAVLSAAACSGMRPATSAAPASPVAEPWSLLCPPVIGGADVAIERGDERIALVLTAIPTMAEDVYERARQVGTKLSATGGMAPRAGRISVSRIDDGARLVIEASNRMEAARLGDEVTTLVHRMRSGGCPPLAPPPQVDRPSPHDVQRPSGHHH